LPIGDTLSEGAENRAPSPFNLRSRFMPHRFLRGCVIAAAETKQSQFCIKVGSRFRKD
jgi:hypothetical protein